MDNRFIIYIYILFISNINNISSIKILEKYGTIKTNNEPVVFCSEKFSVGERMNFKISSTQSISNKLSYQYYDNINDINFNDLNKAYKTKYNITTKVQETTSILGVVIFHIRRFTIIKKEKELNGLKGDYLLLNFHGDVTIENTRFGLNIIIFLIICTIIGFILVRIVIYFRYKRLMNSINNASSINNVTIPQINYQQNNNNNSNNSAAPSPINNNTNFNSNSTDNVLNNHNESN